MLEEPLVSQQIAILCAAEKNDERVRNDSAWPLTTHSALVRNNSCKRIAPSHIAMEKLELGKKYFLKIILVLNERDCLFRS